MNIPDVGQLVRVNDIPEWLISDPIVTPFFPHKPLRVAFDAIEIDPNPIEFESAIHNFLQLTLADKSVVEKYVQEDYDFTMHDPEWLRYYNSPIVFTETVWELITAVSVRVVRRECGDKMVYVKYSLYCEWDIENGLQIVYRNGKQLCRVSDQDGYLTTADAFGLAEDQDEIYRPGA